MANEWVMSVCWDPLRILAIVSKDSLTHEYILQSKEFGINLCSMEQAHLASYAGRTTGHKEHKFSHPVFEGQFYTATHIKAPMIEGCVVNAECVLEETIELDEYTGFIGRAVSSRVDQKQRPLIYTRSKYFFLGNQIQKTVDFNLGQAG
jgi:flavin reductase (DIM6/NTAB) family NADH-FMN oxidoreductase RutF